MAAKKSKSKAASVAAKTQEQASDEISLPAAADEASVMRSDADEEGETDAVEDDVTAKTPDIADATAKAPDIADATAKASDIADATATPPAATNDEAPSLALMSEMAALRTSLSKALAAKQASEAARRQEMQLWQAKVAELEEANKELADELDEAEVAYDKLKAERDAMRGKVKEEQEANRLLKLVAQSRTADHAQGQGKTQEMERQLMQSEERCKALEARVRALGREPQGSAKAAVANLEDQAVQMQLEQSEERCKALAADVQRLKQGSSATSGLQERCKTLEAHIDTLKQEGAAARELKDRCKALEAHVEALKQQLDGAASTLPSPPLSSASPSPTYSQKIVELQIECDIQQSRIASLERQLAESHARVQYYGTQSPGRPSTPLRAGSTSAQGLGLGSTSPTKGTAWLATMPGVHAAPLSPLPDNLASAALASPKRRRKSIEHEIASLQQSPRVESTKTRLLEHSPRRRPLPMPGTLQQSRPSRDWYI